MRAGHQPQKTLANLSLGRGQTFHLAAMSRPTPYPRFARSALEEALTDTPVVLVHGPRQCGETTLARLVPIITQPLSNNTQRLSNIDSRLG
jgi:hypothetical protein